MSNEYFEKYLFIITEKFLKKFFMQQSEYIFCKEGCSLCCEKGQYPFSKLEFDYALQGFSELDKNTQNQIMERIKKVKTEQKQNIDEEFMYECPFLINKRCSIYKYRAIICRTHGLLFYLSDKNNMIQRKIPNCVHNNLNYSNVFDETTQTVSTQRMQQLNFKNEPVAYNISLKVLLNNNLTKELNLDFGEEKALIDWFE